MRTKVLPPDESRIHVLSRRVPRVDPDEREVLLLLLRRRRLLVLLRFLLFSGRRHFLFVLLDNLPDGLGGQRHELGLEFESRAELFDQTWS